MFSYIIKDGVSITVFKNGKVKTINANSWLFNDCVAAAVENSDEKMEKILVSNSLYEYVFSNGDIHIVTDHQTNESKVLFKTFLLPPELSNHVLNGWLKFGENFLNVNLLNFLRNLYQNPSEASIQQLFGFIQACNLPITPNGTFLAYKLVNTNYTDIYSRQHTNSVGTTHMMRREDVDANPNVTCSYGFHVASLEYIKNGHYGTNGSGARLMVCEVNPQDVVAVPTDYNNSKMRVCSYKVVDELHDDSLLPDYAVRNIAESADKFELTSEDWESKCVRAPTENAPTVFSTQEIRDILRKLKNHSTREVGDMYGVSRHVIYRLQKKYS